MFLWRYLNYLVLFTAVTAGLAFSSKADESYSKVFQTGAWEGVAYYDDGRAITLCAMTTHYENGFTVSIALRPGGGLMLLVIKPEGFARGPVQVAFYADEKLIRSGQETPQSGGQVLQIEVPNTKEILESLKRGTTLRVLSSQGETSFRLTPTADAMNELHRCVAIRVQSALNAAPKAGDDAPRAVPRDELIPYATAILKDAGLANYRFLPQDADEKTSSVLTWQFEDGSLGSLTAVERAGALDLDGFIGDITAADTVSCKGDFANGKRAPRYLSGMEIRKIFASCSAGAKSFYTEYALVRTPDGFLVKLSFAKIGSSVMFGKESQGAQQDRDRVTRTEESTLADFAKH